MLQTRPTKGILRLVGKSVSRIRIFASLKISFPIYLLITKGENSNFIVEKPTETQPQAVDQDYSNKTYQHNPWHDTLKECIDYVVF